MSKWEKVRLGDVVTLLNGRAFKQEELLSQGKTPVLRVGNFFSNRDWYFSDLELEESKYCNEGDLLYAWSASFGPKIWSGPKAIYHYHIWKLELTNRIDKVYAFYLLEYSTKSIKEQGRGITMLHATKGGMEKLIIPLPPVEIQKQIAHHLDMVSELLDSRKKQLEELDELIKSVFYDMFGDPVTNDKGWEVKDLSEVADVIMGQSPPGDSYNTEGKGTPLLNGPTEFGVKHPIERQWTNAPTRICNAEDILFCVRGATAGRLNIADKEYCLGRGLASIRPKNKYHREYLYLYLKMMYSYFQSTSNGSTFININKEQISSLSVLFVDEKSQIYFTSIIEKIEEQKALVKQSVEETQTLFDALMSQYFDE
ncbi:restriction endonuclease subunit S [Paenibacillus septentrionalis]|uniref:Restriction endonuclease subunit S n=1 Tax=Paenibacillus septentrionalis TaxID=429342 RepID=A0ABW1V667_9BACL